MYGPSNGPNINDVEVTSVIILLEIPVHWNC